jgi:hypothetical protein
MDTILLSRSGPGKQAEFPVQSSTKGGSPRELVVADGASPDLAPLLADTHLPVLPIAAGICPLASITRHLQLRQRRGQPLDTLHLVAHGEPGAVLLGKTRIDRDALTKSAALLAVWGVSRIAIWSCNTGQDSAFIRTLAELTGASVFASERRVGVGHQTTIEDNTGATLALNTLFSDTAITEWGGTLMNQYDAGGRQFNFDFDEAELLTPGNELSVDAKWRFKNVVTVLDEDGKSVSIDAIVSIVDLFRARVSVLDSSTLQYSSNQFSQAEGFLQPNIQFNGTTDPSIKGGYAEFRIDFVEGFDAAAGSGSAVSLLNVNVDLYDIDGNGSSQSARQYIEVSNLEAYAVSTGTLIDISTSSDGSGICFNANNTPYTTGAPVYTKPGFNITGLPGSFGTSISESGQKTGDFVRAQLVYETGISSFQFKLGDSGWNNTNDYVALYALNFGSSVPFDSAARFGIEATGAVVSECGTSSTISVNLSGDLLAPPTGTVTIDLLDALSRSPLVDLASIVINADGSVTVNNEFTLSSTRLEFTVGDPDAATHWTKTQSITVTGLNDTALDGNALFEGLLVASSTDNRFNKLSTTIQLTNLDNDTQISSPTLLAGESAAVFEVSAAAGRVLQFAVVDETTSGMAGAALSTSSDGGQTWQPYAAGGAGYRVPGSGVQNVLVRVDILPESINPSLRNISNSFNLVVSSPGVPCPVEATATILPLSSIGDRVWRDTNVNGQQDDGEAGVAGVVVELFASVDGQASGAVLATTSTDGDGSYSFQDLQPGDYIVKFTAPDGERFTKTDQGDDASDSDADASGFTASYSLAPGESINTVDAGLYSLSSISGNVYHDVNDDGVFDPTESGIGNVVLTLTGVDAFGNAVSLSTTTAEDGSYAFAGLVPGTYSVTQTQPEGWDDGKDSLGSEGGTLSNDLLSGINLLPGVDATNYNFGELLPAPPEDPLEAPGVRTPGFWGSKTWSKFWDGVAGNEPRQCRTKGFPKGDLLFAPYKSGAQGTQRDPVTGGDSAGLLIGDWNRNGITDSGEQTLFYSTSEALKIINASTKPNTGDTRYILGRSLNAAWLNYVAGNPVDTAAVADRDARHWINAGIAWLQTHTPDENRDTFGDGSLTSLASPAIRSSNAAWSTPITGGNAIHTNLDRYNNGLGGLADGLFSGG